MRHILLFITTTEKNKNGFYYVIVHSSYAKNIHNAVTCRIKQEVIIRQQVIFLGFNNQK